MPTIDSRHHFYLGRQHDPATGATHADKPLLYPSKDLTTHAVCVGMTGSGKTGLCVSLIEEALLDGVPVIAIDPKGDLGNLLLAFPRLRGEDFRPWVDESVAARSGVSADKLAETTARAWRDGLEEWHGGAERLARYDDCCERLIFTPGSSAGIPLTLLKSFDAPPPHQRNDGEALAERAASAVSGLLTLVGADADPVRSREHILLSTLLGDAWRAGRGLTLEGLITAIAEPPLEQVGVLDLEQFFPAGARRRLAADLNNLLASPTFAGWMRGAALDVDQLLYAPSGGCGARKPRLSVLSIAHLDDTQRMFFVTILLGEIVAWVRAQPGSNSLRAILYMDEVLGYFPPVANPPSKAPMLTLLKQARAHGLGVVLATQNPVDLDYKGLANCGTWLLGRLQTERDKARVIEGLEGASTEAGAGFDKRATERTLAGLGSRVFLINNVHAPAGDPHRVFHTRWALSYLAGPLTRDRIGRLMDPLRDRFAPPPAARAAGPQAEQPAAADHSARGELQTIRRRFEPLLTAAREKEEQLRGRYRTQKWQVPGKLASLVSKGAVLLWAQHTGGATKRRTRSAVAAFERAQAELGQAWRARGQWKAARRRRRRIEQQRDDALRKAAAGLPASPDRD